MSLTQETMAAITRRLVRENGRALALVNITSTDGGSDRVELLLTIDGCHTTPCRFLLNVSRTEPLQFEAELKEKLRDALHGHHSRQ